MSYRDQIADLMFGVLTQGFGVDPESLKDLNVWVEVPRDTAHGDFAFPCFRLARMLRKSPAAIAGELQAAVTASLSEAPSLASVTALGPYHQFQG